MSSSKNNNFPCHLCKYVATQKVNLESHIRAIHDKTKLKCKQCDYTITITITTLLSIQTKLSIVRNVTIHQDISMR